MALVLPRVIWAVVSSGFWRGLGFFLKDECFLAPGSIKIIIKKKMIFKEGTQQIKPLFLISLPVVAALGTKMKFLQKISQKTINNIIFIACILFISTISTSQRSSYSAKLSSELSSAISTFLSCSFTDFLPFFATFGSFQMGLGSTFLFAIRWSSAPGASESLCFRLFRFRKWKFAYWRPSLFLGFPVRATLDQIIWLHLWSPYLWLRFCFSMNLKLFSIHDRLILWTISSFTVAVASFSSYFSSFCFSSSPSVLFPVFPGILHHQYHQDFHHPHLFRFSSYWFRWISVSQAIKRQRDPESNFFSLHSYCVGYAGFYLF